VDDCSYGELNGAHALRKYFSEGSGYGLEEVFVIDSLNSVIDTFADRRKVCYTGERT
jgi:hypothetical protein